MYGQSDSVPTLNDPVGTLRFAHPTATDVAHLIALANRLKRIFVTETIFGL
jgi:hypothetical protein